MERGYLVACKFQQYKGVCKDTNQRHSCGCDCMVVGFTTISAISAYHPIHYEVHSIQHYEIKFVSDLRHVGGCLSTPVSSTNKKVPPRYGWNIVDSDVNTP